MKALVVGNDYLSGRFEYLLKNLTISAERTARFRKSLLKGKDMVFLSGRNCTAKNILDSLRSGRPVFSEQMLFERRTEISLVRYAERNGLKLVIGSFDAFNPAIKEIKKLISREKVLDVFFSRVGPRQFGYVRLNIVDDLVIQDLGVVAYLFGGEAEIVSSHSSDIYSHCTAHLRSGEANIFIYANKDALYKERSLDIFAERTRIHANFLSQKVMLMESAGINQSLYGTGYESFREQLVRKAEPLREAIEKFAMGKKNPVDYGIMESSLLASWRIKTLLQPTALLRPS